MSSTTSKVRYRGASRQTLVFALILGLIGSAWFAYAEIVQNQLIKKNEELNEAYLNLRRETTERKKAEEQLSVVIDKLEEVEGYIITTDAMDSLMFTAMQEQVQDLKQKRNDLLLQLSEKDEVIRTVLAEKEEVRIISEDYQRKYEEVTDREKIERLIRKDRIDHIKVDIINIQRKSGNEIELSCDLRNWREYGADLDPSTRAILKVYDLRSRTYVCPTTSLSRGRCHAMFQGILAEDKTVKFNFINSEISPFKGEMNDSEDGEGYRFEVYLTQYDEDNIEVGRVTKYFR